MATFKSKMKFLDPEWADKIWSGAKEINDGKGAQWLLPLAVLAVTGARPASLQRGISFEYLKDSDGILFIQATIPGAKLLKNPDGSARRGQDEVLVQWRITPPTDFPNRKKEFTYINNLMAKNPQQPLVVSYGVDAIASSVRNLSKIIWPRRKHHVSPICYRELFSSNAKAAGVEARDLAMAMGHISAESQGKYASRPRRASGAVSPKKPFTAVLAPTAIKLDRAPMTRFKQFKVDQVFKTKLKNKMAGLKPT